MIFPKLSWPNLLCSLALISVANSESSQKHQHQHGKAKVEGKEISNLFKRSGTCAFQKDKGMVAVQTSGKNAGWAMHSDQQCTYGSWCPFACPPGQLMNQWDPEVTSYAYPGSQYGGAWCNEDGELEYKRDGDCCVDGAGTVVAVNSASEDVAFCQTVLPGNEEMLIPTEIDANSKQVLAVPGPDYWAGTAAHYYVNPPGVSVNDGCKWGSSENPYGNWSPYVAGASQDASGNTFVKIGWNPVYLESDCPFKDEKPSFGIRITCEGGDCDGLPCEIDPSKNNVNEMSGSSTAGAGGATFCVVTAQKGSKATIEVFDADSDSSKSAASKKKRGAAEFLDSHHAHYREKSEATLLTVTQTSKIHETKTWTPSAAAS